MRGCILGSIVERLYAPGPRIEFKFGRNERGESPAAEC